MSGVARRSGRRRLSEEERQLRSYRSTSTYRPYRDQRERFLLEVCTWRPRPSELKGLSPTALAFVARAREQYLFNDKAGGLVLASADALDQIAELRQAVDVEGEQVPGTRGRLKVNPKLRELRRLDRRLEQVLKHLGLTRE